MDTLMLTRCPVLKLDAAYILLNGFWILVGLGRILRAQDVGAETNRKKIEAHPKRSVEIFSSR